MYKLLKLVGTNNLPPVLTRKETVGGIRKPKKQASDEIILENYNFFSFICSFSVLKAQDAI